jgi:hypothetical protein
VGKSIAKDIYEILTEGTLTRLEELKVGREGGREGGRERAIEHTKDEGREGEAGKEGGLVLFVPPLDLISTVYSFLLCL